MRYGKRLLCLLCAFCTLFAAVGCAGEPEKTASEPSAEPSHNTVSESEPVSEPTVPEESVQVTESTEPEESSAEPLPEPEDADVVRVQDYIPSVLVELKYATTDNFTGEVIYTFTDAYLRYGTVKKLMDVQERLLAQGYCLKIWDAYRPIKAQFALWEVCPNPTFVANPNKGISGHNRANTVDLTLVLADGSEIPMPTGFDDFSAAADRDYRDVSEEAAENARLLEETMYACGFNGYKKEWWHYADEKSYPAVEEDTLFD